MQVRANARALGDRLMSYGYKLVTDGTDNHLVLWDLRKEVGWLEHVGPCGVLFVTACFKAWKAADADRLPSLLEHEPTQAGLRWVRWTIILWSLPSGLAVYVSGAVQTLQQQVRGCCAPFSLHFISWCCKPLAPAAAEHHRLKDGEGV